MSSIPLAIRPPQNVDPLEQYQRAQGVVGMIQQQRLQQQQIAQNQLSLNDQKAGSDAMHEWDGKDIEDLPGLYIKHGASANAVLSLKNSIIDQQTKRATLDTDTLKNQAQRHDNIAGAMNNAVVTNKDGSFNQDATAQAVESLGRNPDFIRNLSPDEASQLPARIDYFHTLAGTNPDQFQQEWKVAANEHLAESTITKNALDQATTNKANLDAQKTNLENQNTQTAIGARSAWLARPENAGKTAADYDVAQAGAKKQAEAAGQIAGEQSAMPGGAPTQQLADAQYRALKFKQLRGQPLSADEQATVGAYEKQKTLSSQFQFNLQNGGMTGQNGQPSAIAKGLADGSMKWQDVVSARTPMAVKQQLLAEVKGIKPDYNSGDFQIEQKVKEEATSGAVGKQLLAIGTARQHMQLFSQLADALNGGDNQTVNKIGNALGIEFGSDKATNFKIAQQAFGGEVGKALDGAGVVAGEREQAQKAFDAAMSKGQFKGAVQTVDQLLAGKQKAAHAWFDQGTQAKPDFGDEIQPEANTSAVPGPGTAKFHYQGAKGEIFSDDGKTWYDGGGKPMGAK